jgi:hypothetical protein
MSLSTPNASGCKRLQRVGRQDRGGLIVMPVQCRLAAAQVVIVHRRQVVVHERERVNEFDRNGRRVEQVLRHAETFTGRIHEQRPDTLAPIEYGIAHRIVQPSRHQGCGWQDFIQLLSNAVGVVSDSILERC